MELGHSIRHLWKINFKDITFLNHGSFGATPIEVLNKMNEIQEEIDNEPVEFFINTYYDLLSDNISSLAEFLNCKYDDLVLIENATQGINTILRNLVYDLNINDEILFTNHIYPAVRNTIYYLSEKHNLKPIEISIDYLNYYDELIINQLKKKINDKTKLIVIDHIASPTSLIFPIKEIITLAKENNIKVIIDGAHAPGSLKLNLSEMEPDYYVGNCHKWLFSGKGCAFLYTKEMKNNNLHPLVISNDYGNGFRKEFDWVGTRNPSAWLTLKFGIDFYNKFGYELIRNYTKKLLIDTTNIYLNEFNIDFNLNFNIFANMITLPFPFIEWHSKEASMNLRNQFYNDYKIEIMFVKFMEKLYMRYSSQIYNSLEDSYKLIEAIKHFRRKL